MLSSDCLRHGPHTRLGPTYRAETSVVDIHWAQQGSCSRSDPEELFVPGAAQARAKAVCTGCLVRTECLATALDERVEFGVWGGMTERERRALLRRRPTVSSWWRLLSVAREEHKRSLRRRAPSAAA
ncbi:WhiB family transcriptional regulator [Streptomyces sp. 5.8]|uniref:WhiB family transcriptional regulator n=1 Tax=Streptomyces sp. 5.8 TaxID=3406571 RepID=UPI003BB7E851